MVHSSSLLPGTRRIQGGPGCNRGHSQVVKNTWPNRQGWRQSFTPSVRRVVCRRNFIVDLDSSDLCAFPRSARCTSKGSRVRSASDGVVKAVPATHTVSAERSSPGIFKTSRRYHFGGWHTTAPVLFETAADDATVYRRSLQLNNVGKSGWAFLFLERHHHGEVNTITVVTAGIKI
jgi:hypothetical protein